MALNRREFLAGAGAAFAGAAAGPPAQAAPAAPVAVARCRDYGAGLLAALEKMFDQLGGMGRLVKGKTVGIKINMTGQASYRLGYLPPGRAHWNHPRSVGAAIHLMEKAGARRIRVLEGAFAWPDTLGEFMYTAGWDPNLLLRAAKHVDLVNTNMPYPGSRPYTRFPVPGGGLLFPSYELSTAYAECDVLVSMNKIKEHATTGFTLSIKNWFGITPTTIYGDRIGAEEPSPEPYGGRGTIMHSGARQPPRGIAPEIDPSSPRDAGYRIPRCIADLVAACPIHLAIVEGVETMAGGEGPWIRGVRPCRPGLLVAGTNCVATDAVGLALMGFDPMADRGTAPFETSDNTLALAERLGVGSRDLKRIEVIGTPIREAVFRFRDVPNTTAS